MRDYRSSRVHLALKRGVSTALTLALEMKTRACPTRPPATVTGTVVLFDRCLGLGDVLMMSPVLERLAVLGPVSVVAGMPPLLDWPGDWRCLTDWAGMLDQVGDLARGGRLLLAPRLGLRGRLALLAHSGGVPAGVVWLDAGRWLDTASGRVGRIRSRHYTDGAMACAEALLAGPGGGAGGGAAPGDGEPTRLPPRRPADGGAAVIARLGLDAALARGRRLVALAPWATSRIRRWPLEHWTAVIDRLGAADPGLDFVLLGSADEQPAAAAIRNGLAAGFKRERALDLMGRMSLEETAAVIARSALLIACDNGLMHIGLGVGTPLVALFGSTDPGARLYGRRWRLANEPALCPFGRAPCYPDLHRDPACPGAVECLAGLTPERVAALALNLLAVEGTDPS